MVPDPPCRSRSTHVACTVGGSTFFHTSARAQRRQNSLSEQFLTCRGHTPVMRKKEGEHAERGGMERSQGEKK